MATDWQRYLQSQMQAFGVAPPQQPPPMAQPPLGAYPGRGPLLARKAEEERPPIQQYQDPSDVKSQAIQEIRNTFEYAQAIGSGLSDQEAVLWVLREAVAGQQPAPRPQPAPGESMVDRLTQGIPAIFQDPGDAIQSGLDTTAGALGIPQVSDDPNTNVVLGEPNNPAAPSPMMAPQEEAGMHQTAIEADNWERILKPRYQEVYPEELLNSEITRVQAEIDRLENTYPSAMIGEGDSASIGAAPEDGQDMLDEQLAAANLEMQQLLAIRGALYGEPQPDQPWYRDVWNAIAGSPVGSVLNAYDKPSQFMRQNMGGWMIRMAANGQLQPGMVLATGPIGMAVQQMGMALDPAEINRAFAEGGNAAVWEYAVGRYPELMNMNDVERAAFLGGLDSAFDPLNVFGLVAGATKGIPLLGGLMQGADVGANLPGHLLVAGAGKGADIAKATPGVGKLFEPSGTAITRSIGQGAEDIAPLIEGGVDIGPEGEIVVRGPGPVDPDAPVTAAETPPTPNRPFYPDETPFSDEDYAEFVTRTRAGETPDSVIEDIYSRGEGGTPAEVVPGTTGASPIATRDDPLADLIGESPAPPKVVDGEGADIPRPRYVDNTEFNDADFTRYQNLVTSGENADEVIDAIRREHLTAQQALDAPAPPTPRSTPGAAPEAPVGASVPPPVVDGPGVPGAVADAPRAPEAPSASPDRPVNPAYADDPEIMDIPVELKGTSSPELRKYGIRGYVQDAAGKWKPAGRRTKGARYNFSGEKGWRQRVRTVEREVQDGTFTPAPELPSGRPVDIETGQFINRYISEPDPKKAADILRTLGKAGRNSYIDEAGNRFVRRGTATWKEMADGRAALDVVAQEGGARATIIRSGDGSYTIMREGAEAPAKIRALGGMGDPASSPYVPELIDRLKAARDQFQRPRAFDPSTDVSPSTRRGMLGKYDEPLGFAARSIPDDLEAGNAGRIWRTAKRITKKDGRIEVVPEALTVNPDELNAGVLADDLANMAHIDEESRRWLNTSINTSDIRWDNLTTGQRKVALQALGIDMGKGAGVKEIKELVDSTAKVDGFKAPTRGEVYEQLLETMADESMESRIEVWKKIIGGVQPPKGRVGRTTANMGAMVRSSILYNWPRAAYNTMQDGLTNHFVYMMDGQSGVSELHARMMKDYFAESDRFKKIKKPSTDEVERFRNATQEVEAMFDSLGIPMPAMVSSAFGGKFDEGLGRFIEEGHTWWSDMGRRVGGKTGERIGSLVASPSVKRLRSASDDLMRRAGSADYIMRSYNKQYEDFLDEIREQARLGGFDSDEAITRLQRSGNTIFGMPMFSPEDVGRVLAPYSANRANHLQRRWRGRVAALNKGGVKNVERMSFSYMPTNLDEAVGKVWMFHYWMTRASVQHARLALENPALMVQYLRTWQGMDRMKDRENLPVWARQFVSLMVGPYGMLGLVSPASILTGLSVVMDANGVLDDPSVGSLLQQMPFHPIVQAAASVWLNERLPDPTGTNQTRSFAKAAINYLRNEMGVGSEGLTGDPLANLTYKLQQIARDIAPGAAPLAAPSPEQKDTQIVKYYAAEIMRNTPDPENGGTLWQNPDGSITDYASVVMANIDAGLYSGAIEAEALDQFSTDTMAGRMAMMAAPIQSLYPSVIGDARLENRQGYTAENQPLQLDTSTAPIGAGAGSEGFIDPSRPPTTIEQGGSLAVAQGDAGSSVSASLVAALDQYNNLGGPDTQELYGNYNNAIYMSADELRAKYGGEGIVINGERFAWDIWGALPDDARRTYMDAWLKTKGRYEEISGYRAERDAFAAAHPEVEEFKRWQGAVGEVGGEAMLQKLLSGPYPAFQAWWSTQDVKPAKIEMMLMTPSAYLASIGHEPTLWDINDISTKPTVDPKKASPLDSIAPKDTSNTGFSNDRPFEALTPEEKVVRINEKLAVYDAEMTMFNQQIAPYTGGKPFTALGPQGIAVLEAIMQKQGITMPSVPSIVRDYIDWINVQPANTDTSVSAYVASLADLATAA